MQIPESEKNITGKMFGHDFYNGVVLVTQPYYYRFFLEQNYKVIQEFPYKYPEKVERIFLQHHGGLGDTLFIEPVIASLKHMYPNSEIILACHEPSKILFYNNPNLNSVCSIREGRYAHFIEQYDLSITFDCIIAGNPIAQIKNIYDEYKDWAGIPKDIADKFKKASLYIGANEIADVRHKLKEMYGISSDERIVVISYHTSTSNRDWDKVEKFYELADKINQEYQYKILMMGQKQQYISDLIKIECPHCSKENTLVLKDTITHISFKCVGCDKVIDIDANNKRLKELNKNIIFPDLSLREWIALIVYAEAVIGLDSIAIQIAGSLDTPCLGIFGAFDPDLRMRYFEKSRHITPKYYCSNCFLHHMNCPQGSRQNKDYSLCMATITVDDVFDEFEKLIKEEYKKTETILYETPKKCPVCGSENRKYIGRKNKILYYDCLSCKSTYADQTINCEQYYNEADYYNIYIQDGYREGQKEIAKIINTLYGNKFKYNGKILDIGCADGSQLIELKRLGWDVKGIEISKHFKSYYNKNDIEVYVGDYKKFKTNSKYDVIALHHSLEHFDDPHSVLEFCKVLLNDNGYINVIIPITDEWNKNDNRWGHFNTYIFGEHVVLYSTESFKFLCEKHNLIIVGENDLGFDTKLFSLQRT